MASGQGRITFLFLGGAKRVGMARLFEKAAQERGIELRIIGYELDRLCPLGGKYEIVEGLRWSDPAVFAHLGEVVKACPTDILFKSV